MYLQGWNTITQASRIKMYDFGLLKDLVIILAAAVTVVTLLDRLKIPAIAGFILAGVASFASALPGVAVPIQTVTMSGFWHFPANREPSVHHVLASTWCNPLRT